MAMKPRAAAHRGRIAALALGLSLTFLVPGVALADEAPSVVTTLTIDNPEAFTRVREPVTCGIPLGPETTSTDANDFALVGPEGPIESQMTVTARWGGAPSDASRPIRWLLADFVTDVPARDSADYALVRQSPPPVPSAVEITDAGEGISIDTSAATFFLSKTRFGLIDSVTLAGCPTRDLSGTPIVATDRAGNSYSSVASAPVSLVVEVAGPLRVTVRAEGGLRGPAGELVDCTAWLHFYRDTARVKIDLRVENRRVTTFVPDGQPDCWDIGSPRSVWIDDLSVRVPPPAGGIATATVGTEGGPMDIAPTGAIKL